MRYDEADKADHAAHRHGRRCHQRGGDDQDQPGALNRDAQLLGLVIVQLEHVEPVGVGPQERPAHRQHRTQQPDLGPVGEGKAAHQPADDVHRVKGVLRAEHQEGRHRPEERTQGHAGQQQSGDGRAAPYPGDEIDQHRGPQRADEGEQRDRPQTAPAQREAKGDSDGSAQSCSR